MLKIYNNTMVKMLEHERNIKVYKIHNLIKHINNFVNLQDMETTSENYKILLEKFYNYCLENKVNEININNSEKIIKEYKAHLLKNTNLKSSSINNYILRVQAFFKYLGIPTKIKKLNNGTTSKPYKYLTKKEIDLLINTIENTTKNKELKARNTAIINLMFVAGLRIKEVLNITKQDFIINNDVAYISIIGKGKTDDTKELIAIPNHTKELINNYLETRQKRQCNYLFCNIQDKQLTRQGVNKMLHKEAIKTDKLYNLNINPRCTTHVFRHSLARYLLINKNVPISQVKDILRHSKIETTAKYLTNSQDELTNIRINLLN